MVFLPEALEGVPGCTFGRPVVFLACFWSHFGGILELFWRDFATRSSVSKKTSPEKYNAATSLRKYICIS